MPKTSIEWTDVSWPVVNGCRRISPGCGGSRGVGGCYAERLAATRLRHTGKYKGLAVFGQAGPHWTGETRLWAPELSMPLRLKKPSRIFVADMGDLFYEKVSDETIAAVYAVMALAPRHTFQVLTKRSERARAWYANLEKYDNPFTYLWELAEDGGALGLKGFFEASPPCDMRWPLPNVWLGVSCEDQKWADERVPDLLATPAAVRWVSYEPALGPVDFSPWLPPGYLASSGGQYSIDGLDWIVCGGESGPGARSFDQAWMRAVRDQCAAAGTAFFAKQMGRWILGEDAGFKVDHWLLADGRGFCPPFIGENAYKRPPGAIGFSLWDKHGGTPEEWPVDLRVRQYPEVPS